MNSNNNDYNDFNKIKRIGKSLNEYTFLFKIQDIITLALLCYAIHVTGYNPFGNEAWLGQHNYIISKIRMNDFFSINATELLYLVIPFIYLFLKSRRYVENIVVFTIINSINYVWIIFSIKLIRNYNNPYDLISNLLKSYAII